MSAVLFSSCIHAGFPSPADDHIEQRLSLDEYFISSPSSTFFVRVCGTSMIGACVAEGDIVVVDRSLAPKHMDLVIAVVEGEFFLKRLQLQGRATLVSDPEVGPAIDLQTKTDTYVWGVVSGIVRKLR